MQMLGIYMRRLQACLPLGCLLLGCLYAGMAAASPYSGYSGLVAELGSGRVLYERNPDEQRHPASLTKMMTLYLVFDALSRRELALDSYLQASRYAVVRAPSRLGLNPGDLITVEQGILGLVTRSANDVAAVIAESLASTESAFAERMTAKARELGMSQTLYRNASGLPDPQQVTTATDQFRLGRALYLHFPQYYRYFSTPSFEYEGHSFQNHNHLMERYVGMDGIKTGFINASGFNLVASAERNGRRLIGVVFGGDSAKRRDAHMQEILDDGFAQLEGAQPQLILAPFDRPAAPALLARPGAERPARLARSHHASRRNHHAAHGGHSTGVKSASGQAVRSLRIASAATIRKPAAGPARGSRSSGGKTPKPRTGR